MIKLWTKNGLVIEMVLLLRWSC